jgi:outer membrane protein assembly factor BamB
MAKVVQTDWARANPRLVAVLWFCVLAAASGVADADDWPQWRGPNRDGISRETSLIKSWPKDGPRLVWQVKDLGGGYSTPAIVDQKLYLVVNKRLDDELVKVLEASSGREIWSTRIGKVGKPKQRPAYPGARSTPTVEGGVLYALGSDGDLVCLEREKGEVRWRKNLITDFGGKSGTWAYSESPLIDGDALICTPGGSEATMLALNKKTGDVIWKCPVSEGDEAAYSSAIVVEVGGVRQYVQLLQKGLVGVEAKTGKFLWRYGKPVSPFNANIPTPVASGDIVYVGSAGKGGGAVKLAVKDGKVEADELYFTAKLPTAIGGAVKLGDFLYGTTANSMVCIEFATGEVKWQERALGAASICYADGRLYLHGENGDVALVEPSPESYKEISRFTPPNQPKHAMKTEKAWAYPVVANGLLYIRDLDSLWCYEIRIPGGK